MDYRDGWRIAPEALWKLAGGVSHRIFAPTKRAPAAARLISAAKPRLNPSGLVQQGLLAGSAAKQPSRLGVAVICGLALQIRAEVGQRPRGIIGLDGVLGALPEGYSVAECKEALA